MKAVIIEDEKAAVRNLTSLLEEVRPGLQIITVLDSIAGAIEWFSASPMPDLVFMDIHLADGSAFEIFEHIRITCPVVFTTAYDEYALRAFKVNSIDYLLKPIGREDIGHAFEKLNRFSGENRGAASDFPANDLMNLIHTLKKQESYKTHFLIPVKSDKLLPVSVDMICFFYIQDGIVKGVLKDGSVYPFPQTLDELTECLNPARFFRVNRQYLLSREAIRDIDLWFNSRLSINLRHPVNPDKILVSKTRVSDFKSWFTRQKD